MSPADAEEFSAAFNPFAQNGGRAGESMTRLAPVSEAEQRDRVKADVNGYLRTAALYTRMADAQADPSGKGSYRALAASFKNRATTTAAGYGFALDDFGSDAGEADSLEAAAAFGNGDPRYGPTTMFGA
jgi:hypothetical protein